MRAKASEAARSILRCCDGIPEAGQRLRGAYDVVATEKQGALGREPRLDLQAYIAESGSDSGGAPR